MSRVVHFDITANDVDKVIAFYEKALGWKFQKWEGPMDYWLVTTGEEGAPGINGGFGRPDPEMPGTVNTVDVANIDDAIARVKKYGGTIVRDKHEIPGVGWLAYFSDPEGTIFGMMEADPNAQM